MCTRYRVNGVERGTFLYVPTLLYINRIVVSCGGGAILHLTEIPRSPPTGVPNTSPARSNVYFNPFRNFFFLPTFGYVYVHASTHTYTHTYKIVIIMQMEATPSLVSPGHRTTMFFLSIPKNSAEGHVNTLRHINDNKYNKNNNNNGKNQHNVAFILYTYYIYIYVYVDRCVCMRAHRSSARIILYYINLAVTIFITKKIIPSR